MALPAPKRWKVPARYWPTAEESTRRLRRERIPPEANRNIARDRGRSAPEAVMPRVLYVWTLRESGREVPGATKPPLA
jgi:hypothetical protein